MPYDKWFVETVRKYDPFPAWVYYDSYSARYFVEEMQMQEIKLNITQEQLAEICEVSPSYIGQIKRGSRKLSVNTAVQLCSALGIRLDYLFLDSAEENSEITNCINSALSVCSDEQKRKLFKHR